MKNIVLPAFVVVALIQWFVPLNMIWEKEKILTEGTAFKFETAPIDPVDPFRGRYVHLNFTNNQVKKVAGQDWQYNQEVYVKLKTNAAGFAIIDEISERPFDDSEDYVKANVSANFVLQDTGMLTIQYPFDIFYMEEFKAPAAEIAYREAQIDSTQTAYALVRVRNGQHALENVFVDEVPLQEVARSALEERVKN